MGNVAWKKNLRTRNDLSMEMHSNEGRVCLHTLVDRKRKCFDNAVDVVELLLAPTDQAPNVRHLRVLHRFSSATSLTFLIQQGVKVVDEFREHDGVVAVMVK